MCAGGLAAYCEVNHVFAMLEFESNQPWQYDLLLWLLIVLAGMFVVDTSRVVRSLREDAVRRPSFWVGAKAFFLLACALVGILCLVAGQRAYAHWELRFLRRDPEPVAELQRDYEERFHYGAVGTADWIEALYADISADATSTSVLTNDDCDPEDNPTLIVVDRAPDWSEWNVHEPEDGFIVASLRAGWAGVAAVPGAKVLSFDGQDLGIDTFDVELRERYYRITDDWVLLDSDVRVEGRWEDY